MTNSSFIQILLIAVLAFNDFSFGKESHLCDSRSKHEKHEGISSNCLLRDSGRHLWCWGGFHNDALAGSESIRALTLCDWLETSFDPQEVLTKFPSLKKFTLARSNLINLSNPFPAEARTIEIVDFIGTKLAFLPVDTFANLTSLRTLDLRNNSLSEVNPRIFNESHLQHVHLSGNPWKCNENMSWILDMQHHGVGKRISDREKLQCAAPYENRRLVPVVEIIITLKEECKKTVCDCELVYVGKAIRQPQRQLMAFVTTNCSDRGLTEMPGFLPENTTTLHLKGNKISDLTPLATNVVYKQVQDLYLDGNVVESITQLEGSFWLDHFRVLSLRSNQLTDLPTYALENALLQSRNAVSIYLGDNPWRCDCLFTPGFQDLLIRYTNLVKDVNDVRCYSAVNEQNLNKQIRDLTRTEICMDASTSSWLNPLDVLNVILASLIALIIGKLLYDCWSFKKTGKLPWIVAKIP